MTTTIHYAHIYVNSRNTVPINNYQRLLEGWIYGQLLVHSILCHIFKNHCLHMSRFQDIEQKRKETCVSLGYVRNYNVMRSGKKKPALIFPFIKVDHVTEHISGKQWTNSLVKSFLSVKMNEYERASNLFLVSGAF